MNRIIVIGTVFLVVVCGKLQAQSSNELAAYKNLPQEKIYIHHNTTFLLAGEYLYYKLYCLDAQTDDLSMLSKIAYVEMVGENGKIIYKHKLRLDNGIAQGDFFVPVNVPSGNYKIVGYTQWMRNSNSQYFFQGDITVVNPYQGNQKSILKINDATNDSISIKKESLAVKTEKIQKEDTNIKLVMDQKKFSNRAPVTITLKRLREQFSNGTYSLSVRKIDTINLPSRFKANNYYTDKEIKASGNSNDFFVPELRGDIVSGKIVAIDPNVNGDLGFKKVAISIPGENYEVKVATTDANGTFNFILDKEYNEDDALLQVLGEKNKYKIELDPYVSPNYSTLKFNKFELTSAMKDLIVKRSIYNQIRNGYFTVKPDTLLPVKNKSAFYGSSAEVYDLDDYTRFPTLKETLVEIINNVWFKKNKEGNYILQVRAFTQTLQNSGFLPLVVIDGVLVQDHDDLVEYNANRIKRISILRDQYLLGSQVFQGLIEIETKDKDFHTRLVKDYIQKTPLFKPLPNKKYFRQQYTAATTSETNKIPDFRHQLLWMPDLKITEDDTEIEFFTSDNKGSFEVCLEGFTVEGKPVSLRDIITVE